MADISTNAFATDNVSGLLGIARQGAMRDLAEVRETLLGLRHSWAALSPALKDQADALLDSLDDFAAMVGRVTIKAKG